MRRALFIACMTVACAPEVPATHPELVDVPTVVGVVSTPAEARPGERVELRPIVVAPPGQPLPALAWSFCREPRTPAASTSVAEGCVAGAATTVIGVGPADQPIAATVPTDACALFGSEPTPAAAGEPPRRPVEPDPTGGHYQPVRVAGAPRLAFGAVRLTCALPAAPAAIVRELAARRTPNVAPVITAFAAAEPPRPSARVAITVSVDPGARERYLRYDAERGVLIDMDERLSVAWFVTAGSLDAFGSELPPGRTSASVVWQAPATSTAPVTFVAVVRDDRGGTSFATFTVP